MKLYKTPDGQFHGTQADARKADRDFQQVEVPTDKAGLIAYLNGQSQRAVEPQPLPTQEQVFVPTPARETPVEKRMRHFETMVQVEEYIQGADYDEARRIQSLAIERLVEHVTEIRMKRRKEREATT